MQSDKDLSKPVGFVKIFARSLLSFKEAKACYNQRQESWHSNLLLLLSVRRFASLESLAQVMEKLMNCTHNRISTKRAVPSSMP
jgi:hypothetical protein